MVSSWSGISFIIDNGFIVYTESRYSTPSVGTLWTVLFDVSGAQGLYLQRRPYLLSFCCLPFGIVLNCFPLQSACLSQHSLVVLNSTEIRRYAVQIPAWSPDILTSVLCKFPQHLETTARIVSLRMRRSSCLIPYWPFRSVFLTSGRCRIAWSGTNVVKSCLMMSRIAVEWRTMHWCSGPHVTGRNAGWSSLCAVGKHCVADDGHFHSSHATMYNTCREERR